MSSPPLLAPGPTTPSQRASSPQRPSARHDRSNDIESRDTEQPVRNDGHNDRPQRAERDSASQANQGHSDQRQRSPSEAKSAAASSRDTRGPNDDSPTQDSAVPFANVLAQATPAAVLPTPVIDDSVDVAATPLTTNNLPVPTVAGVLSSHVTTAPEGVTVHYSGFAAAPAQPTAATPMIADANLTTGHDAQLQAAILTTAAATGEEPATMNPETAVNPVITEAAKNQNTVSGNNATGATAQQATTAIATSSSTNSSTNLESTSARAEAPAPTNGGASANPQTGAGTQQQFGSSSNGAFADIMAQLPSASSKESITQNFGQQINGLSAHAALQASQAVQAAAEAAPDPVSRALGRQITNAIQQGWQQEMPLVVRLTPPELGTLRIIIQDGPDGVAIRIATEDDGVRHALERALPNVRQEMKSDTSSVHITIENQSADFSAEDGQKQSGTSNHNQDETNENGASFAEHLNGDIEPETPPGPPPATAVHDGMLSQLA